MSGKFYSRRGFLGLTAAAGAGLGLSACTGAAPSTSGTGSSAPAPTSNELRLFTYEGDETIDLLKAQIKIFDGQAGTVTTVDSLPGSGAAIYPDKLRTELLAAAAPTSGGSGAARSVPRTRRPSRPWISAPTTRSSAGTPRSTRRPWPG